MKYTLPLRPLLLPGLAAALLAGCATRPPPPAGPPPKAELPPQRAVPARPVSTPRPRPTPRPLPTPRPAPVSRKGVPYTIQKGESLSAIAAKNKISWKALADYNRITDPNKIRAGQVILLPPSASSPAPAPVGPRATPRPVGPAPAPIASGDVYVVQSGDSLSVIAVRAKTTVRAIKELNGLSSDRILVGQKLKLPQGSSAPTPRATPAGGGTMVSPAPTPAPVDPIDTNPGNLVTPPTPAPTVAPVDPGPAPLDSSFPIVVEDGETLADIARAYIVPEDKIRELNNLGPNDEVKAGDTLRIPPSVY